MAADTANQKVFIPLKGVLDLQDAIRNLQKMSPRNETQTGVLRGLIAAVEVLGLPIETR